MRSEEFWLIWFPSLMAATVIIVLYLVAILWG